MVLMSALGRPSLACVACSSARPSAYPSSYPSPYPTGMSDVLAPASTARLFDASCGVVPSCDVRTTVCVLVLALRVAHRGHSKPSVAVCRSSPNSCHTSTMLSPHPHRGTSIHWSRWVAGCDCTGCATGMLDGCIGADCRMMTVSRRAVGVSVVVPTVRGPEVARGSHRHPVQCFLHVVHTPESAKIGALMACVSS